MMKNASLFAILLVVAASCVGCRHQDPPQPVELLHQGKMDFGNYWRHQYGAGQMDAADYTMQLVLAGEISDVDQAISFYNGLQLENPARYPRPLNMEYPPFRTYDELHGWERNNLKELFVNALMSRPYVSQMKQKIDTGEFSSLDQLHHHPAEQVSHQASEYLEDIYHRKHGISDVEQALHEEPAKGDSARSIVTLLPTRGKERAPASAP